MPASAWSPRTPPPTGLAPRLTLPMPSTARRASEARIMPDRAPSLESLLVVTVASFGTARGEVGDSSRGCLSEAGEEAAPPDVGNCAVLKRLEDR